MIFNGDFYKFCFDFLDDIVLSVDVQGYAWQRHWCYRSVAVNATSVSLYDRRLTTQLNTQ